MFTQDTQMTAPTDTVARGDPSQFGDGIDSADVRTGGDDDG